MKKFVDNNYGKDIINTYRGLLFSNLERSRAKDIEDVETMNFVPQAAYGLSFNPLEYGIIPEAKNDTGIKLGDVINGAVGTQMGRYFQYSPQQLTGVKWSVKGQPGTGIRDRGFIVEPHGYAYACGGLKRYDGVNGSSTVKPSFGYFAGNKEFEKSYDLFNQQQQVENDPSFRFYSYDSEGNKMEDMIPTETTITSATEILPTGWQQYNFDDKVKGTIFTGDGNTQANIRKYQASPDSIKVKYNRIPRSVMKDYLSGNMQANSTQPVSTTPTTGVTATTDASVVPTSDRRFIDSNTQLSSSEFRGNKPKAIQRQIMRNNRAYMRDKQDAWKQNQIATAQQKYNPTDSFEFTGNNLQQNYDVWKQNNKNYRDAVKQINRDARNYFTRKPNDIYESTAYFKPEDKQYACGGKKMALGGKDYIEFFNQDRGTTTTPNGTYDNNLILKSKAKEVNGRDNWWATDMALWDGAKLAANVYDAIQQNKQNNEIRSADDIAHTAYLGDNYAYLSGSDQSINGAPVGLENMRNQVYTRSAFGGKLKCGGTKRMDGGGNADGTDYFNPTYYRLYAPQTFAWPDSVTNTAVNKIMNNAQEYNKQAYDNWSNSAPVKRYIPDSVKYEIQQKSIDLYDKARQDQWNQILNRRNDIKSVQNNPVRSYQNGGVYDLTPDEIREIYANGGRVEFLD